MLGVMVLAFVVLFVLGTVLTIRPFGPVKHRWQGLLVIAAAILVLPLMYLAGDDDRPSGAPLPVQHGPSWQPSAAPASPPASQPTQRPAAPPAADRAAIDASFTATQSALFAAAKPCDDVLNDAARTHGQYASYNVSVRAKAVCAKAGFDLKRITFAEPVPADARADLDAAVQCLSLAYMAKSIAMDVAIRIEDGDQRPSQVAEFRSDLTLAGQRHHECLEQYAIAAAKHGFAHQTGLTDRD